MQPCDLIDFPVSWEWYRHYCKYYGDVDPGPVAPELVIRFDADGTVHCSDDKRRLPVKQTPRPVPPRQVTGRPAPESVEQPKYRRSIDGIVKNQATPKTTPAKSRPSPIVDLGIAE